MPRLVLGPLLRYAGETQATIWVETDVPCEVEVLGRTERTFGVAGHHYALVCLHDLEPASEIPYELRLDGERHWPLPDSTDPPSLIRTQPRGADVRLAFGSCRVAVPNEPPYTLTKDQDERGREVDAVAALAARMREQAPAEWPHALLLLGDQVYADEVDPVTRELIDARRPAGDGPPPDEVANFEEYTSLYRQAWGDPHLRWVLSTVSTVMIFDDHDVRDDWNTSQAWVDEIRRKPWWRERILGAYQSYWLYQHLGNLSPRELEDDALYAEVRGCEDAEPQLRAFAERAQNEVETTRWSYRRDFGATRLLVLDSRAGRVLQAGRREMLCDAEWDWIDGEVGGEYDHLLLATSLPYLLAPGLHHLEAWNEAVCDGAWGRRAARLGERVRQALDLEHWAAFHDSFARLTDLIVRVGSGRKGTAPATIVVLSGDVHHAYVAEASFPGGAVQSKVVQAVCSPVRNPLDRRERRALSSAGSPAVGAVMRVLARAAGVKPAPVSWRFVAKPTFDNQIGTLELSGREARVRIERTSPEDWRAPQLYCTLERTIS